MIDLHTHTCLSDGSSTPTELLNEARLAALSALSITDHDTLQGFDIAMQQADKYEMELVCGVELSTTFYFDGVSNRELPVHLLGYFLNQPPDREFRRWLVSISSCRRARNTQLMERLQSLNINISWEDFPELGPDSSARPHFAKVLVAKGYASDFQQAFDEYLSDLVLEGIKRKCPPTQDAIQRVIHNGGLAVLAHPARLKPVEPSSLECIIQELCRSGLGAIEVYHSDHTQKDTAIFLQMAEEYNLLTTGGSDYHGKNKPEVRLGIGRGNLCLPDELLDKMKKSSLADDALKQRCGARLLK